MSVMIGIDFGAHHSSIAVYNSSKDLVEVIADDLGSRSHSTLVAYKADEILTGTPAVLQYHSNVHNTFANIRDLLANLEVETVSVPSIEADIAVEELASHFFKFAYNLANQDSSNVVQDCIISVPQYLSSDCYGRIMKAANLAGLNTRAIICDNMSTCLAYDFDGYNGHARILNVDFGWSNCQISVIDCHDGLLNCIGTLNSSLVSGKTLVSKLADFCATEFERKYKTSCRDSRKSMIRLQRACETAIRSLSTKAEVSIDIDSLFEGIDYSTRISRARFEDVCMNVFSELRNCIVELFTKSGISSDSINFVVTVGGLSNVPRLAAIVKDMFPNATSPRGQYEPVASHCVGAALWGKYLTQRSIVEHKTESIAVPCIEYEINLHTTDGQHIKSLISRKQVLPHESTHTVDVTSNTTFDIMCNNNKVASVTIPKSSDNETVTVVCSLNGSAVQLNISHGSNSLSSVQLN